MMEPDSKEKIVLENLSVILTSEVSTTFRCQKACHSLDIDAAKKATHELHISEVDLRSPWQIGVVVGASGSGKSTLAETIWGGAVREVSLDSSRAILDQLPESFTYEECADALCGIGLTSVPCWVRPVYTLSTGQKARAEAAKKLLSSTPDGVTVLDEWTSTVDRVVAKVMSHCVQKFARKNNRRLVLISCHYDVVEWLDPDWVIDCNQQKFIDRRRLRRDERRRREQLTFEIREVDRSTWRYFSKYHYLSDKCPPSKNYYYGLFCGKNQIGFQCFSNYVPNRVGKLPIYHSNRVVIHPDYAGMGLGIRMVNECAKLMKKRFPCQIMAAFSSTPMYRARLKDPRWSLERVDKRIGRYRHIPPIGSKRIGRQARVNNPSAGFRQNVVMYVFRYVGELRGAVKDGRAP